MSGAAGGRARGASRQLPPGDVLFAFLRAVNLGKHNQVPMADLMAGRGPGRPMPALIEGERAFASEPVDRTWAPAAEAGIYAKLAEIPGLKLIDLQVECRSTMCRIQMTEPSGGSAPPFKDLLGPAGLEPAWMATIKERTGPVRSAAYLWRAGFAPPNPAPGQPHDAL